MTRPMARRAALTLAVLLGVVMSARAGLAPGLEKALREARYVYIQSERKTGELGTPAEIWFLYHDGAVYVGTRPTSFRVRRIQAKRTRARVAVGKIDGPAFDATGELVRDPTIEQKMLAAYAAKYPDGWKTYEKQFRDGFARGDRVLVRYRPR